MSSEELFRSRALNLTHQKLDAILDNQNTLAAMLKLLGSSTGLMEEFARHVRDRVIRAKRSED